MQDRPKDSSAAVPDRRRMRIQAVRNLLFFLCSGLLLFNATHVSAQNIIVRYSRVFAAPSLSVTIVDFDNSPVSGAVVEEMSENWKDPLRSTKTDAAGVFIFSPVKGRKIYYFKITFDGLKPLEFRMKVSRLHHKPLRLTMLIAN